MKKIYYQTLNVLVALILAVGSLSAFTPRTEAAPLIDNLQWAVGSQPDIQILLTDFFNNLDVANRTLMLNNVTAAINQWNSTYLPVDASIPEENFTFGQLFITNLTAGETPVPSTQFNITFADLPDGTLGELTNITVADGAIVGVWITLDAVELLEILPGNFDWANVAAHEMGHGVGLGHDGPPSTLMFRFAEFLFFNSVTTDFLPLSNGSIKTLQRFYG